MAEIGRRGGRSSAQRRRPDSGEGASSNGNGSGTGSAASETEQPQDELQQAQQELSADASNRPDRDQANQQQDDTGPSQAQGDE